MSGRLWMGLFMVAGCGVHFDDWVDAMLDGDMWASYGSLALLIVSSAVALYLLRPILGRLP